MNKILVNRYTILLGFMVVAAIVFYLMFLITSYLYQNKIDITYEDQWNSLIWFMFGFFAIHYILFMFIAILGWHYAINHSDKNKYMVELKHGFFLSILFMIVLGISYFVIFYFRL
jgi:hypothetical protein